MLYIKTFIESRKQLIIKAKTMIANNEVSTPEYELIEAMIDAINQMRDYVVRGDWGRHATVEKYAFWLSEKMNYSLTARKYHTKVKSIRVLVSRTDRKLRGLMEKPLMKIMAGEIDDGLLDFNLAINKFDIVGLFGVALLDLMPDAASSKDCFALCDCQDEIQFLRDYNSTSINNRLKTLDTSKLAYLLSLASNDDAGYIDARKRLIKQVFDND